ncbi:hypothetical protein QQ045_022701 [Rhodiola kirilowii]
MGSVLSSFMRGAQPNRKDSDHPDVLSFHSAERFRSHLNSIKDSNQLMVIHFSASWCGPCQFIEPVVDAMASEYKDVSFANIDADELSGVAKEFGVTAMPTFVLLKGGKEIDRVAGAEKNELERKIQKYRSA